MRLLNANTLRLQEFHPGQELEYAILSHTWGAKEITYEDIAANGGCLPDTLAASKIRNFCKEASLEKFRVFPEKSVSWVWVDTCCINKSSSAELQEAINSMFSWYKSAYACYVYLEDVKLGRYDSIPLFGLGGPKPPEYEAWARDRGLQVKQARWLTRGWTLQELIASKNIVFFDRDWDIAGTISDFKNELVDVIGIPRSMVGLMGIQSAEFAKTSVQKRIYWARNRQTTRPEDRAYSLLGLLDVSMPMIYGEGMAKAFKRLKREVKEEHGVEVNFDDLY